MNLRAVIPDDALHGVKPKPAAQERLVQFRSHGLPVKEQIPNRSVGWIDSALPANSAIRLGQGGHDLAH